MYKRPRVSWVCLGRMGKARLHNQGRQGRENGKHVRGVDNSNDCGIENVPSPATMVGLNKASLFRQPTTPMNAHWRNYIPKLNRLTASNSRIQRFPSSNIHDHQTPHFPIRKSLFQMSPSECYLSSWTLFPLQPTQDEFTFERSQEFSLIRPILHHPEWSYSNDHRKDTYLNQYDVDWWLGLFTFHDELSISIDIMYYRDQLTIHCQPFKPPTPAIRDNAYPKIPPKAPASTAPPKKTATRLLISS